MNVVRYGKMTIINFGVSKQLNCLPVIENANSQMPRNHFISFPEWPC